MPNKALIQTGFSLVELVMVIVLISVLAIGGFSMFASRSSYATFVAKDLFISKALLAQQYALGSQREIYPVSLDISVTADAWVFSLSKVGMSDTKTVSVASSGNSLEVDGTTLAVGASHRFEWTRHAQLRSASNHRVRFAGDNPYLVCLSAEGYAYESTGACP